MALRSVESHTCASSMRKKLSECCTKTHTLRQPLAVPCTLLHRSKIKGRLVDTCKHSVESFSAKSSTRQTLQERNTPDKMLHLRCPVFILFPTLQLGMYQKLLLALFILLIHASSWFMWRKEKKLVSFKHFMFCTLLSALHLFHSQTSAWQWRVR